MTTRPSPLPSSLMRALGRSLDEARELLRAHGAGADLYSQWFHRETGHVQAWPSAGAYRAAILDAAAFEPGWRVTRPATGAAGACLAMRGGFERLVQPPEMVADDPRALAPGRGARLRVHPLTSAEAAGFWHLWSAGWQRSAPERLERVYLRVRPEHAIDLARTVATLARPRATWAMKVLCGAHDAGRRDGALIYCPAGRPAAADPSEDWLVQVQEAVAAWCEDDLPPFVFRLRAGLGWAPDPGDGRSFGQAVAQSVASAAPHVTDPDAFAAAAVDAVRSLPGMHGWPERVPLEGTPA